MSGQAKTEVVEIRVTPAELADWRKRAQVHSVSMSELIRRQMRGSVLETGDKHWGPSERQLVPVAPKANIVQSLARTEVTPRFRTGKAK
jgi:hypothetical protein